MYNSWLQDLNDKHKTYKDYALFLGAFSNWEMAKKMSKKDNPDYETSDEDFEASYEMVIQSDKNNQEENSNHRKRRRVVK